MKLKAYTVKNIMKEGEWPFSTLEELLINGGETIFESEVEAESLLKLHADLFKGLDIVLLPFIRL